MKLKTFPLPEIWHLEELNFTFAGWPQHVHPDTEHHFFASYALNQFNLRATGSKYILYKWICSDSDRDSAPFHVGFKVPACHLADKPKKVERFGLFSWRSSRPYCEPFPRPNQVLWLGTAFQSVSYVISSLLLGNQHIRYRAV